MIVVVGAELDLPEPVRFGPVQLGQPPRHASVQLPPDPALPDVPGHYVVTLQQVTRIHTSTFYWAVVDAENQEDALRIVERDIDPVVSVGLALVLGHEVPTQVLRAVKCESAESFPTSWGAGVQLRRLTEHRPDRAELAQFLNALKDDEQVSGCLPYLTRATTYLAVTPTAGDLALDAALLELAKTLEYLVRKTPTETGEEDSRTTDRVLTNLSRTLTGNKGTRRKVSAVKDAARSLHRLERRTVSDSVRAFATQHDMGPRWTATATRLIEVRHKHLAHPGERMPNAARAALSRGQDGAQSAVHDAIRAVLQARTGRGIPSAPASRAVPEGDVTVRWQPGPVAAWSTDDPPGAEGN